MAQVINVDICVIGAGAGGLSVAAGASQLGASTILIEKGKMGGDCLNYGCVPSKALLAAGHIAHNMHKGKKFGITATAEINFPQVQEHVQQVIDTIAPNDSIERFTSLGIQVIQGVGHFVSPQTIEVNDSIIKARRFVIATGSMPMLPAIPGLDKTPHYTNETIFQLRTQPKHLIIIGGGPIGIELAQAHHRLGCDVTVLEGFKVLSKDEPEFKQLLIEQLKQAGIQIHEQITIDKITGDIEQITIHAVKEGKNIEIIGSHLLVATGRTPNINALNLEAANVKYHAKGIEVDTRLRTTNKKIFAIGDVASPFQFTHTASYHAGIVIRNALFRLPAKVDYKTIPWVIYTDPELAHVGLTEENAKQQYRNIKVLHWQFAENDRAQAERETVGLIKVITTSKGVILGLSILGTHAGELLQPWCLAMSQKLKIGAVANLIVPYPTLGEINKRVAGSFFTDKLFSQGTRKLVKFLSWWG